MLSVIRGGDDQPEEAEGEKTLGADGMGRGEREEGGSRCVRLRRDAVRALIASPQDADLRGAAAAPR